MDQYIYSDEAISDASTERRIAEALAAAGAASRPFDCILVDDTSRLTRNLADALSFYERLTFAGVRVVAVSQGVDSESSQAELLIGVHGLIGAVYWRELGQKTHRGMQGLALRGFHTGGRCFGYESVKLEGSIARLEIDRAEAEIINRIYRLNAESHLLDTTNRAYANAEGVRAAVAKRAIQSLLVRVFCPTHPAKHSLYRKNNLEQAPQDSRTRNRQTSVQVAATDGMGDIRAAIGTLRRYRRPGDSKFPTRLQGPGRSRRFRIRPSDRRSRRTCRGTARCRSTRGSLARAQREYRFDCGTLRKATRSFTYQKWASPREYRLRRPSNPYSGRASMN